MAATAAMELPRKTCVDPELGPSLHRFEGKSDPEGWRQAALDKTIHYRVIAQTQASHLPSVARQILGETRIKSGCSDRIVFSKADIVEIRYPNEHFVEATISIDKVCVLCSHGYNATFHKQGGKWKIEPKLTETFVS